jgi:aspartate/tyrosine/aromatic aminotransferase
MPVAMTEVHQRVPWMFDDLTPAPADSIFGLNDLFLRDTNPDKINLTVGVYQNEHGRTPILDCVRDAESALLASETTKDYLSMDGWPDFNRAVADLVLSSGGDPVRTAGTATIQTLGGTGALRLTADLLADSLGHRSIWHSDPTWPNHLAIFHAAGLEPVPFRYLDASATGLDFAGMVADLRRIPDGSPVLLHTVCHNPTGIDLSDEQWEELVDVLLAKRLIAVLDFAYQGFGTSVERDAWPVTLLARQGVPLFVCSSFSKNMGLYGERVGACTVIVDDDLTAANLLSHLKAHARCSYSNPVRHGPQLAALVLGNASRRAAWLRELDGMRVRLAELRRLWIETLHDIAPHLDFRFILEQRGMFSYTGLDPSQVQMLRDRFSVYALNNGRINVAGIRPENVERLCVALGEVCNANRPSRSLTK